MDEVEVTTAFIVEMFRSVEHTIRDLEAARGRRSGDSAVAMALGRLDAMKDVLHVLAPEECDMVSWKRE